MRLLIIIGFSKEKNPLQSINVKADKHISSLNLDHRAMPLPLINLFERYIPTTPVCLSVKLENNSP